MWSTLVLACLVGPNGGPEASALVARLGSGRFAEREAAAEALEDLGAEALEALRAARSDPDAEVRGRVGVLLDRIEAGRLSRPTLVRLDREGEPVGDVVARIAAEQDWPLSIRAENAAGAVAATEESGVLLDEQRPRRVVLAVPGVGAAQARRDARQDEGAHDGGALGESDHEVGHGLP